MSAMNTKTIILWGCLYVASTFGCAQNPPIVEPIEDTDLVPINVSKAGGDIIQQQRIVNVSDGTESLPGALWSVGGVGSLLAGYVVWLIRHHLRRRRQLKS